jgi:small-conductance mechanosensitive channel
MSTRTRFLLWTGLLLSVIVIAGTRLAPSRVPDLFHLAGSDTFRFLTTPFFRVGSLSVTLSLLIKSFVFLVVLNVLSTRVRHVLYTQLLKRTTIGGERSYLLARFASLAVFSIGLLAGLEAAGMSFNTLAILGGTLGIGVGFGLQSIVANWVAGLVLLIEQPVRIGDCIDTRNTSGVIIRIGGRSTWVRTYDNQVIIIPNSDLTGHQVTNWTANDPRVRLAIPVGVAYDSDLQQVRKILTDIMSKDPEILTEPPPEVVLKELGDNSINFLLRFWTIVHPDYDHYGLKSNLYFAILESFRQRGIEVPFPQRDIHLRSADVPVVVTSKSPSPGPNETSS